eukprot:tig00000157_g9659.t1
MSPRAFFACISAEGAVRHYNKMLRSSRVVQRISQGPGRPQAVIQYAEIGLPKPVWDRDMVYAAFTRCTPDGTCIAGSTPTCRSATASSAQKIKVAFSYFDVAPGRIVVSGWIARPVAGEPDKSHVTYIANADLGGWIPAAVANAASSTQALIVARARRFCTRE